MTPRPQYQALESVKINTLWEHQVIKHKPHFQNFSEVTPGPGYQDTENMRLSSDAHLQVALTPKPNKGLPGENMKSVLSTLWDHSVTAQHL